ncbi:MAG: ubiquinol-cytochrome c reductase iron-sulfur subunit N-terminal domain-containing protein, partial [Thermaurantiacus sp.]
MATQVEPLPPASGGPEGEGDVRRRDFIYIATGAFAAVGAVGVLWPMVDQMNPSADVL